MNDNLKHENLNQHKEKEEEIKNQLKLYFKVIIETIYYQKIYIL